MTLHEKLNKSNKVYVKNNIWGHFITYWKDPISQSLYKNNDAIAS